MNGIIQLHAIFSGVVQGVGFRMTVKYQASRLGLNGIVRNLPDGRVEAYVQGDKAMLLTFLERTKKESGAAKVESVETEYSAVDPLYPDFRIVI